MCGPNQESEPRLLAQPGFFFSRPIAGTTYLQASLCCHHRVPLSISQRWRLVMTTSPETVFRQRLCRAKHCGRLFFICSHCDRGQCYCSVDCRHLARLDQLRAARRRHQQSPEGQCDHSDRQRAYRQRLSGASRSQAQKTVTDHASKPDLTSDTIAQPHSQSLIAPLRLPSFAVGGPGSVVCHFCGRRVRFIDPFHESG